MHRRQALTSCGNGAGTDNVEILQSGHPGLKRITLHSIVKVYRVTETPEVEKYANLPV